MSRLSEKQQQAVIHLLKADPDAAAALKVCVGNIHRKCAGLCYNVVAHPYGNREAYALLHSLLKACTEALRVPVAEPDKGIASQYPFEYMATRVAGLPASDAEDLYGLGDKYGNSLGAQYRKHMIRIIKENSP